MWTTDMYRKVAAALWGAISLAIGLSIGVFFDMTEKKKIFVVVVVVGIYLISLLRWSMKNKEKNHETLGENKTSDQGAPDLPSYSEDNKQQPVKNITDNESDSANDESREWLDEFLIKQQKD